jgi:hypothetical protein
MNRRAPRKLHSFRGSRRAPTDKSVRINANLELERLRTCLLFEHMIATREAEAQPWVKRAADEAVSIAWATTYPLLVFPVLLAEKLNDARQQNLMQQAIYARSRAILALTE